MGRKKAAKRESKYKDNVEGVKLDLSMQSLDSISVIDLALLPFATSIDLSLNHLKSLPDNFPTLDHIVVLDLSKNQIDALPDTFGQLTSLKRLDLLGNNLSRLPHSFAELTQLQWLDLKDNPWHESFAEIAIVAHSDSNSDKEGKDCAKSVLLYMTKKAKEKAKKDAYKARVEARKHAEEEAARRAAAEQARLEKKRLKAALKEERRQRLIAEGVIPNPKQDKASPTDDEQGDNDADELQLSNNANSDATGVIASVIVLLMAIVAAHLAGLVDLKEYASHVMDWISSLDGATTIY
eukprot:TRINITY_DN7880_c0_g1_i2.p1 TRINITY_DN7880_c0_g1~~TRINITY_DN7880_c0_g1_i2.p1  ORF type:complete len:295 (+),score=70.35 TRINITY_DN7880_c0_g1_i2:235-1119(+)